MTNYNSNEELNILEREKVLKEALIKLMRLSSLLQFEIRELQLSLRLAEKDQNFDSTKYTNVK